MLFARNSRSFTSQIIIRYTKLLEALTLLQGAVFYLVMFFNAFLNWKKNNIAVKATAQISAIGSAV